MVVASTIHHGSYDSVVENHSGMGLWTRSLWVLCTWIFIRRIISKGPRVFERERELNLALNPEREDPQAGSQTQGRRFRNKMSCLLTTRCNLKGMLLNLLFVIVSPFKRPGRSGDLLGPRTLRLESQVRVAPALRPASDLRIPLGLLIVGLPLRN